MGAEEDRRRHRRRTRCTTPREIPQRRLGVISSATPCSARRAPPLPTAPSYPYLFPIHAPLPTLPTHSFYVPASLPEARPRAVMRCAAHLRRVLRFLAALRLCEGGFRSHARTEGPQENRDPRQQPVRAKKVGSAQCGPDAAVGSGVGPTVGESCHNLGSYTNDNIVLPSSSC
jgi:hypothetical protein